MSYEISPHKTFLVEAKHLKKRYRSFNDDKEDASTVKLNVIKQMARELGFDV